MAASQISTPQNTSVVALEQTLEVESSHAEIKSTYDTRAFGDFGWEFVNAGED